MMSTLVLLDIKYSVEGEQKNTNHVFHIIPQMKGQQDKLIWKMSPNPRITQYFTFAHCSRLEGLSVSSSLIPFTCSVMWLYHMELSLLQALSTACATKWADLRGAWHASIVSLINIQFPLTPQICNLLILLGVGLFPNHTPKRKI